MKKFKYTWLSFILPILFLLFWHGMSIKVANPLALPTIGGVLDLLLHPTESVIGVGSILKNTYISLLRVACGYLFAVLLALPLGIIIGLNSFNERLLLPFLSFFRSVPPLAWVPLVLAWFGIASLASVLHLKVGQTGYLILNNMRISMIIIIFLGAFFPVLSNVIFGIRNVRKTLIDAARSMGANTCQMIIKILLPAALPAVFTGLQVGLGTAWMCLICAEMLPGSISGIGYMISHAYQVTRIDVVIAGIVAISIVSTIIDGLFTKINRKAFKWQSQSK